MRVDMIKKPLQKFLWKCINIKLNKYSQKIIMEALSIKGRILMKDENLILDGISNLYKFDTRSKKCYSIIYSKLKEHFIFKLTACKSVQKLLKISNYKI